MGADIREGPGAAPAAPTPQALAAGVLAACRGNRAAAERLLQQTLTVLRRADR